MGKERWKVKSSSNYWKACLKVELLESFEKIRTTQWLYRSFGQALLSSFSKALYKIINSDGWAGVLFKLFPQLPPPHHSTTPNPQNTSLHRTGQVWTFNTAVLSITVHCCYQFPSRSGAVHLSDHQFKSLCLIHKWEGAASVVLEFKADRKYCHFCLAK